MFVIEIVNVDIESYTKNIFYLFIYIEIVNVNGKFVYL